MLKPSLGIGTSPEQSWAWSGMRWTVTEGRRTSHHGATKWSSSTWTDKSSRKMAGLRVTMKNVSPIQASLHL